MYVWVSELVSIPELACTCHPCVCVRMCLCHCVCVCFRVLHASPHFLLHLIRFCVCFHAPCFHVSLIIVIIFAGVQYLALKINKQTSKQTNMDGVPSGSLFSYSSICVLWFVYSTFFHALSLLLSVCLVVP